MITEVSYQDAAVKIGCEVNVIKAVAGVESSGSGFLHSGKVVILFEPHIFWQQLSTRNIKPDQILIKRPELSNVLYQHWKEKPYGPVATQWMRMLLAATVNHDAAFCSASWGKFQIMGYHFKRCGYSSIDEMEKAFSVDESNHLKAFVNFIITGNLQTYLQGKDWKGFALRYNGAGYRNSPQTVLDDYDYKLNALYTHLTTCAKPA